MIITVSRLSSLASSCLGAGFPTTTESPGPLSRGRRHLRRLWSFRARCGNASGRTHRASVCRVIQGTSSYCARRGSAHARVHRASASRQVCGTSSCYARRDSACGRLWRVSSCRLMRGTSSHCWRQWPNTYPSTRRVIRGTCSDCVCRGTSTCGV